MKDRRIEKFKILSIVLIIIILLIMYVTYKSEKDVSEACSVLTNKHEEASILIEQNLTAEELEKTICIPEYMITLSEELQELTYTRCLKKDTNYELILAMLYHESKFNENCVSYNKDKNGIIKSNDEGIAQINNKYEDWYGDLAEIEGFDRMNPKHGIEACISAVKFYREYWIQQGIEDEELLYDLVLLSYNRGITGATKYIKKYGYSNTYIDRISEYKMNLERKGSLNQIILINNINKKLS